MDQELEYRGVRTLIGIERDGIRRWSIHPASGPADGAAAGYARAENSRGSFKEAVFASREAIDALLSAGPGDVAAAE